MASPLNDPAPSRSHQKLVLAGQLAFLPTGLLTTLLGPMLPILIVRWGLSDTQAGNLFLVQFLASLVTVQLSGVLLAKLGFRPAFLLGLLMLAGGAATIYLGSLWLGMIAVGIYGCGIGFIVPTDNLLIAEISPASRASAVSMLNFFWGIGAVISSLGVSWANTHHLLPAFLGAVTLFLVLLALGVRNLPFPPAVKSEGAAVRWRELWRNPVVWLFATVFLLYPGAETAVGGWIGSYVTRMSSAGTNMGAMMPAFFWGALMLGRGLGGMFLRYASERRVLQMGFAFGTVGIVVLLWTHSMRGVIFSAIITGLSFSVLYPVNVARFSQHFGVAARSIGALMFSLASVGPALVPWIVGVISNATGNLRLGLAVPLVATFSLFLIHLPIWPRAEAAGVAVTSKVG